MVHVALFGGPMRPDGQMAMSNSPAVGGAVTVTGPTGRAYTADTDQHGDNGHDPDPLDAPALARQGDGFG